MRRYDKSREVKKLKKQILAIYGDRDLVINGKNQARFLDQDKVRFIKGGHGLFKEAQIEEISMAAVQFLKLKI